MPSEFDDKQVLLVSGIGVGLYAAHHLLAPRHAHDSYMEAVSIELSGGWRAAVGTQR